MSLDERIKRELENEADDVDRLVNESEDFFKMATSPLRGGLKNIARIATAVALIVSAFMIWSAYEFAVATNVDDRVFWGVWFVITLHVQVGVKQWIWMEINRNSLLREVKRLEVAIARLTTKTAS